MKTPIVIASLIVTSAVSVAVTYASLRDRPDTYADHVQRLHMDVPNGVLRISLGTSSTPGGPVIEPKPSSTLVLTPRAAIQLHVEIGQIIRLIHQQAAGQRVELGSVDPTL